jgi:hypothetical protein
MKKAMTSPIMLSKVLQTCCIHPLSVVPEALLISGELHDIVDAGGFFIFTLHHM